MAYLALPAGQDEGAYRAGLTSLAQRTRSGYAAVLRPVDLAQRRDGAEPAAIKLIDDIADALQEIAPELP